MRLRKGSVGFDKFYQTGCCNYDRFKNFRTRNVCCTPSALKWEERFTACLGLRHHLCIIARGCSDSVPFGKHSHSGLLKKSFSSLERFILNLTASGGFVFEDFGMSRSFCSVCTLGIFVGMWGMSEFRNRELADVVCILEA